MDLHMLDRPAAEGARAVVLALLREAAACAGRARRRDDPEALHDLRVAVRRLRTNLCAWRCVLRPAIRRRDLHRLRRIARATSAARDAEVLAAWIAGVQATLPPAHRAAAAWLSGRIEERRRDALDPDVAASAKELLRRTPGLVRRLERLTVDRGCSPHRDVLAALLHERIAAVGAALRRASAPPDPTILHEARIEAKRLRYLLEPLEGVRGLDAGRAVKELKRLQDRLGLLHDAGLAVAGIASARWKVRSPGEGVRGRTADLRAGLRTLERLARLRERDLLSEVARDHLADGGVAALGPALEVVATLERG